jgi:hypothetical protein
MKHPPINFSSGFHYELIFSRNSMLFPNTYVHPYHRKIAHLQPILSHFYKVILYIPLTLTSILILFCSPYLHIRSILAHSNAYAIIFPNLDCCGIFYLRENSENGRSNDRNIWIRIYSYERCVCVVR